MLDVTAKEANRMLLDRSIENLVCSFTLDLPDVCLDILTSQFYIIVNVARNLLLAAPPVLDKKIPEMERKEKDAETDSKIAEIERSSELLARHNIKSATRFDINNKPTRDEIKVGFCVFLIILTFRVNLCCVFNVNRI